MTGFGAGRAELSGTVASVEARSVNNRHLKVVVRGSDPYPLLESDFEAVVRKRVRRGTVTLFVRVERPRTNGPATLDVRAVAGYLAQLAPVAKDLPPAAAAALYSGVLALPGVTAGVSAATTAPDDEWPLVERATEVALGALTATRAAEGRRMGEELSSLGSQMRDRVATVKDHVPTVVADYRVRLKDRIAQAVSAAGVTLDESNLIREVALYADRTDVAEELTRLTGHLAALSDVIRTGGEGAGRRLKFLAQELGREANTLGSKAADAVVSRHAVEIKTVLERFRELVLNVE